MNLIVCVSRNYGLGMSNGDLLFHIEEDLARFKKKTSGGVVVMGMKTFQSIIDMNGKPLPKRTSVVLTRKKKYKSKYGEIVFNNVESIVNHCKTLTDKDKEVWVCGGAEIYRQLLPHVEKVHMTMVYKDTPESEIYYPMDAQESLGFYPENSSEEFYSEKYDVRYKFITYKRPSQESASK